MSAGRVSSQPDKRSRSEDIVRQDKHGSPLRHPEHMSRIVPRLLALVAAPLVGAGVWTNTWWTVAAGVAAAAAAAFLATDISAVGRIGSSHRSPDERHRDRH